MLDDACVRTVSRNPLVNWGVSEGEEDFLFFQQGKREHKLAPPAEQLTPSPPSQYLVLYLPNNEKGSS
jgi:hypothetical protein